ncbi:MAG: polymer-forming cytoskeletal protein [Myxococcota bacterium]|nr:polymer-forming cytoskeletal protein [Myxococcota bacterium]
MANALTYIDSSLRIEGSISATEDLHLAGHLVGRIETTHALVIERDGIAEASVSARRVEVHGVVVGDLVATEDVWVSSTGQVQGNITARRLQVEAGGRLDGEIESGGGARPLMTRTTGRSSASRPPPVREHTEPPAEDAPSPPAAERPAAPKAKKKKKKKGKKKTRTAAPASSEPAIVDIEASGEVVEIPEEDTVEEAG